MTRDQHSALCACERCVNGPQLLRRARQFALVPRFVAAAIAALWSGR